MDTGKVDEQRIKINIIGGTEEAGDEGPYTLQLV